ncbi:MAG: SpoIIE family protein phosphatase [Chloroflexota bacterium]
MGVENAEAWNKGCDCQTLCLKGKLDDAYNEVRCSRLGDVSGEREGLVVHASSPLRAGGDIVGILNVAAPSWDSFSPRALSLLANVGAQVGVALERAQLYDMLQERLLQEQGMLLNFTNQLLSRLDLDDVMSFLVDEVRSLLAVDACALLLPDEEDPTYLRFRATSGWRNDPAAAGRRVPADERSSSGLAMYSQEPVILTDVNVSDVAPWMADWLPQESFLSAGIVPLIAEGRSIGALVVDTREQRQLQESDVRLLQLMANQAALALEKARLHHEEIQRQRLDEELSVARQIQLSMLPPRSPQAHGWEFSTYYEAARQVGGDFYDFFDLPNGEGDRRMGVVVADVADKGVPAALFMALSRTTIRNVAIGDRTPAAALEKANKFILSDSQTDLFLTAFYAALELDSGRLVYCNAGHNPPLWYHARTGELESLQTGGIALGIVPDLLLQNIEINLEPGDVLIFYTDGVTEAMNAQYEEFGLFRLQEAIPVSSDRSAHDVAESVVAAVNAHSEEFNRWDDVTLIVVRRKPNANDG